MTRPIVQKNPPLAHERSRAAGAIKLLWKRDGRKHALKLFAREAPHLRPDVVARWFENKRGA